MRIALAQINTTIGDVEGNAQRAIDSIRRAADQGAEMVVLPELTLSGYPPQDLVERLPFIEANERMLQRVADAADGVWAVVGYVGEAESRTGKLAANSVAVVRDGKVVARRDKTLLPSYDVFDEHRHFQPAITNEPVHLGDLSVALTICEDAWNDRHFWDRRLYESDPVERLASAGVDIVVNIAASPFAAGKQQFRRAMMGATAKRYAVPLICVNLVGGNDQLVFDGRSAAFDEKGRLIAEGAPFAEDLVLVDTEAPGGPSPQEPGEVDEVWRALNLGLADYVRKCGFERVVLALSGGIDSALTAALAASALGPDRVTALFLPSTFSSERSRRDAETCAANLGIRLETISIEGARTHLEAKLAPVFEGTERGTAEENIQARVRGLLVMAFANKFNCLPLATGNKSELAVGYCTLYGDMVGGLAVIGDVPKTMVYRLADHLNRDGDVIPQSTIERPPTAELKPDQTDQDVLPPYDVLDAILALYVEQNEEFEDIVQEGFDPEMVRRVLTMVDRAEYKRRQAPITLRVTSKAFGPGRRLPVAQRWPR